MAKMNWDRVARERSGSQMDFTEKAPKEEWESRVPVLDAARTQERIARMRAGVQSRKNRNLNPGQFR
jgi:hypothetical protein